METMMVGLHSTIGLYLSVVEITNTQGITFIIFNLNKLINKNYEIFKFVFNYIHYGNDYIM